MTSSNQKQLGAVRPAARVHAPQPLWVDEAASSLGVAQAKGVKPALPQEGAQLMHGCLAQCQPLWGSSGLWQPPAPPPVELKGPASTVSNTRSCDCM